MFFYEKAKPPIKEHFFEHLALNIAIVIAGVPMFEMQNFPAWANSSLVEKIKSC